MNMIITITVCVLVVLFLMKRLKENYEILDGESIDNKFYPENDEVDFGGSNNAHEYTTKQWREPRYGNIQSPHSDTPPFGVTVTEDETINPPKNYPTEHFSSCMQTVLDDVEMKRNPYVGPSGRTHYDYNQESAIKPECAKELYDNYYFNSYPYVEHETWDHGKGRFESLRY